VNRTDYAALLDRIAATGSDSRLHRVTGPGAGSSDPWDGATTSIPGIQVRGLGTALHETVDGAVFAETLLGHPRLVIAGGGHVGMALAPIAATLGFEIVVIDERPEFATRERFPDADQVLCGPYADTIASLPDYANTYYVLVTPGHRSDRASAETCLSRQYAYIGMIGSRAKVARVTQALLDAGVPQSRIDELHAPIGLDLGGREPAEIAVAIAAEVIQVRARRDSRAFDPAVAAELLALGDRPAVLTTIVGHSGSVPRGTGSRMLVAAGGPVAGSVGGGAVENAAILRAQEMLRDGVRLEVVDHELSDAAGAALGMICGGRVRILSELL
jgi:xanthine dehydrogenase accessory factor